MSVCVTKSNRNFNVGWPTSGQADKPQQNMCKAETQASKRIRMKKIGPSFYLKGLL